MYNTDTAEHLVYTHKGYIVDGKLIPTQQHELKEEILNMEKEFANEIYLFRDRI